METRGAANTGGTAIRLKYSRQFQQGGHTHTIDAEATLAAGIAPEQRERTTRELEASVELLARQINRRAASTAAAGEASVPSRVGGEPLAAGRTASPRAA